MWEFTIQQYINGQWIDLGILKNKVSKEDHVLDALKKFEQLFELKQERFAFHLEDNQVLAVNVNYGPLKVVANNRELPTNMML